MELNEMEKRMLYQTEGCEMAVFRVEKTKDFTIMCNHHLRNTDCP